MNLYRIGINVSRLIAKNTYKTVVPVGTRVFFKRLQSERYRQRLKRKFNPQRRRSKALRFRPYRFETGKQTLLLSPAIATDQTLADEGKDLVIGFTRRDTTLRIDFGNVQPGDYLSLTVRLTNFTEKDIFLNAAPRGVEILNAARRLHLKAETSEHEWRLALKVVDCPEDEETVGTPPSILFKTAFPRRRQYSVVEGVVLTHMTATTEHKPPTGHAYKRYKAQADDLIKAADIPVGTPATYADLIHAPADANVVYDYLSKSCPITTALKKGTFYPYPTRPRNFAWYSYGAGALYAWRATGDARFVEWVLSTFKELSGFRDTITGKTDQIRGRIMPSWGANIKPKTPANSAVIWTNEVCTGAMMALPALRCVLEVAKHKEELSHLEELANFATGVADEVINSFRPDLVAAPNGTGSYFQMPYELEAEPYNHSAPWAALCAVMYALKGDKTHKDYADRLADNFKAGITKSANGAPHWPYRPTYNGEDNPAEFYFKGRVSLIFPLVAHEAGCCFSTEDMQAFARTFTANVHTGGSDFNKRISGGETTLDDVFLMRRSSLNKMGSLAALSGYMPLAVFDPAVCSIIENATLQRPEIFSKGWFTTPQTFEAYAWRLHKNA